MINEKVLIFITLLIIYNKAIPLKNINKASITCTECNNNENKLLNDLTQIRIKKILQRRSNEGKIDATNENNINIYQVREEGNNIRSRIIENEPGLFCTCTEQLCTLFHISSKK
ncbi:hypothetical protein PVAND_000104 [Polypedilum vanderplanki]|uniref:Secreted protein n=1 Tax=Polypedilum vanderplanki TaxID=319348 RepID=A0A9J6BJU2_POLVA|nr:hypothetical protein PVAND_000104 [Polypedilum vanderplanki]